MNTVTAIIAGNGPSLAEIDYSRLPSDFDVFRCNQFYCEQNYYLGKHIKYAFFNPHVIFEQIYTAQCLRDNQDYQIDNVVSVILPYLYREREDYIANLPKIYPQLILGNNLLDQDKEIAAKLSFYELYHNKRVTAGVYMCIYACLLGYKKLYLTGIDLYAKGSIYAFKTTENVIKVMPKFREEQNSVEDVHDHDFEVEILNYLKDKFAVQIYVLSPASKLTEYFPLAPVTELSTSDLADSTSITKSTEIAKLAMEKKPETAIVDMQIPTPEAKKRFVEHFNTDANLNRVQYLVERLYYHLPLNFIKRIIIYPTRDFFRWLRRKFKSQI